MPVSALQRHWADPLYRNGGLLMMTSVVGAGFGFLFWLFIARLAPPAEVGAGAALVSAMTLAALLGKFGLDAALIRWAGAAPARARRRLLLAAGAAAVVLSAAIASALLAAARRFPESLPAIPLSVQVIFVASAALTSIGWVLDAYFIAERRAGRSLARAVVFNVVKLALPLAAIVGASAIGILSAWAAGVAASVAVALLLAAPLLRREPVTPVALPGRPEIWRYAGANYAVNVAEWLPSLVLPLLVLTLLGAEANAVFYVAWTIAAVGFFASKAIAQSAFAEMSAAPANRDPLLRRAAGLVALVLAPFMLLLLAFGGSILRVFGPDYEAARPLLGWLALSIGPVAIVNLRLAVLKVDAGEARSSRRWELIFLPLLPFIIAIAAASLLLESLGVIAVGIAWLGANVIAAGWSLLRQMAGGPSQTRAANAPEVVL